MPAGTKKQAFAPGLSSTLRKPTTKHM